MKKKKIKIKSEKNSKMECFVTGEMLATIRTIVFTTEEPNGLFEFFDFSFVDAHVVRVTI